MKLKVLSKFLLAILFALVFSFGIATKSQAVDNVCLPTQPPPACGQTCTPGGVACPQNCSDCISGDSGYKCQTAPSCGTACTKDGDCNGAKDGCTACVSGSCKTPPACGVACSKDGDCAGAKDSCSACVGGTCHVPPACGVACSKDGDCAGAKDSCSACVGGTCHVPPACGVACSKDGDCAGAKDGCSICTNNKCSVPPTATPTPVPFSENMCKCDGMDAANIGPGLNTSITAYGKVEGDNQKYAKISSVIFNLYKGDSGNIVQKIQSSNPIDAVVIDTQPDVTKYKAVWNFTFPKDVQKDVYRVQAEIQCSPKTAGFFVPPQVMGAATKNNSIFGQIVSFITQLFGGTPTPSPKSQGVTGTANATPVVPKNISSRLNLGTFEAVNTKILEKSCTFIRFQFE